MNIYGTSTQETESLSHVGINEKQVHRKLDFLDHVVNQSLEKKSIDSHLRNKYIGSWISQAYMNIYKYLFHMYLLLIPEGRRKGTPGKANGIYVQSSQCLLAWLACNALSRLHEPPSKVILPNSVSYVLVFHKFLYV